MYEAGNGHGIWFRKEEPMLDEWAAHGQPTCSFWDYKNSPSVYEMDHKRPCVLVLKFFEVNDLSCVEIDRLVHEFNVLT